MMKDEGQEIDPDVQLRSMQRTHHSFSWLLVPIRAESSARVARDLRRARVQVNRYFETGLERPYVSH